MKLDKKDKELIEIAAEVVKANSDIYSDISSHVACAVRADSGKIYKGINLYTSHSVCAEQVAIGQAFVCGERDLETIVAVKLSSDGSVRVVSPCGLCRYIFDKFELDFDVIVEDVSTGENLKTKVVDLLPYPYKRQINSVVRKNSTRKK